MLYYKTVIDNIVVSVNTVNLSGNGNINADDYAFLVDMFRNMPGGNVIRDNGDGSYSYDDAPPLPEPEPTDTDKAEAYDILVGGAE